MGQTNFNRIINKLLFRNQDKKQLFFVFFGGLIGFVFMSLSIQFLIDLNSQSKNKEILDSNAITIQKKISNANTLSISNSKFSKNEVVFYENLPFIEKVVLVQNNNFPVELNSDDPLIPYFRSDIFIQSIPSDFLDVHSTEWNWSTQDSVIPIILPRDFVYMMNNFLSSTGMPQLSDDILEDVHFNIKIGEGVQLKKYNAKIIGFTNEISSILVPESFMNYGKDYFKINSEVDPTQLMLKSKKGQFGLVEKLLNKNHLEVKKNQLIEGKLKSLLNILLSSISLISFVVVLISVIVLIQYLQLLITQNAYEIRTMLRIGVSVKNIVFHFVRYVFIGLIVVLFFVFVIDFYLFTRIFKMLNEAGFSMNNPNYIEVVLIIVSLITLIFVFSIFSVNKFVRKEF